MRITDIVVKIDNVVRYSAVGLITLYQKTISPGHSAFGRAHHPLGFCKFYPSCSEYAKRAFKEHNALRATLLALFRIVRCNPWSRGGIDYSFSKKGEST